MTTAPAFFPNIEALESWSTAELVAWYMYASQPSWFSDDEAEIES